MTRSRNKVQTSREASRLRQLRDLLGMTQREFATEIKVAHGAVAAWESGKQAMPGPVLKLLELYEEELGISVAEKGLPALKTSMLARNSTLARTAADALWLVTASAFQRMLSSDDNRNAITRRTDLAIARRIVATLGELKGAAMKLGQTFGYLDFGIPRELQAQLASLQVLSRPMSPAAIAQVFLEEFGEPPRRLFAEWTPQPFAAASIGQVHRARLRSGEEVAVKVQYPSVAQSIDADLRTAALLDRFSGSLFRGQELGALLAEVRERFTEECDYLLEAQNQELFRRLHAGRGIRVPRVFPEFTRSRVLVSEYVRGQDLDAFIAGATAAERDRAGARLWSFTVESIFDHGLMHADPHPGNFLFADGEIVVLDFGCVKRFPPALMQTWRDVVRALAERRGADLRRILREMGFAPDPQRYDFDAHQRLLMTFAECWLGQPPFRFTHEYGERVWREAVIDNPNKFRTNLPRDWLFVNRLQFGLCRLLARLGSEADFRTPMLDLLYAPGEQRPDPFDARELAPARGLALVAALTT